MKADRLLEILACPLCRGEVLVERKRSRITCKECWSVYPLRGKVPIMLPDPDVDHHPKDPPPANPYAPGALELIERHRAGLVLDCGAGYEKDVFPHVVQLEIYPSPTTDIVGDALHLPFRDQSFDAAISEAVVEHVTDPFRYAREMHRVLKEGGEVRVDAPFLNPYHAVPGHYFNMTREGLDRLFSSFQKLQSGVGPHQEPWVTLRDILGTFAEALEDDALRSRFFDISVGDLLRIVRAETDLGWLRRLHPHRVEQVAAGVYFHGIRADRVELREPERPAVSVVVTGLDGAKDLRECVQTITGQRYPKKQLEIILVHGESNGRSVGKVKQLFPRIDVLECSHGMGTAGARMMGASRATGEYLAFLDSTCRCGPDWLEGLLEPIDREGKVVCTASRILDGRGRKVRTLPGGMDLLGRPGPVGRGEPARTGAPPEGPVLYPLAEAMLIDREVFFRTGGFDTDFVFSLEDLDLGWRLWVLGYRVHHAPGAPVRQKDRDGRIDPSRKALMQERNALLSLYKNYEEENLRRVLPAAILLVLQRGWSHSRISPGRYRIGAVDERDSEPETLSPTHAAHLLAVDGFLRELDRAHGKRLAIQRERARPDREILSLAASVATGEDDKEYRRVRDRLLEALGLDGMLLDSPEEDE